MPPTQPAKANPQQMNRAQRQMVLDRAVPMRSQIFSGSVNQANQQVLNIPIKNVGLIKRFLIKIAATVNNTGGASAALSDFGLANLLQQVVFTDLNNNIRVQTSGAHLTMLAAVKQKFASGAALLASALNQGSNLGNNFGVFLAPTPIAAAGSGNVQAYFELPLAYSDEDLRGAIYANVVNATAGLTLTIPTAAQTISAAGADSTSAVYAGSAGNLSNITITVYQEYLDQLPRSNAGVILPVLDVATVYELKSTAFGGIVQGQLFPFPFANFRDFLSAFVLYNHDGSGSTGRVGGTDLTNIGLQSANFTNLFQDDPITNAYKSRLILESDLPPGLYYESFRKKPISTVNYGNMQLFITPSTAAAAAYAQVWWEDFALTNTLASAGSLAG